MKNRKVIPKKNSTYRLKSGIWGGPSFQFLVPDPLNDKIRAGALSVVENNNIIPQPAIISSAIFPKGNNNGKFFSWVLKI